MKIRTYVTGVANARHNVEESMEETPLVARAVYPPVFVSVVKDGLWKLTKVHTEKADEA